jgi:hypothetical protein
MKWTPLLFGSLTVVAMTACSGNKGNNNTGTAGGSGTESGTMQGSGTSTTSDTGMAAMDTAGGGMSGMSSDTATGGSRMHSDTSMGAGTSSSGGASARTGSTAGGASARTGSTHGTTGNQTKSGVTDTKTGKSTLGKGVLKTRPDQGQPVTSKGDTISNGPDTNAANQ